MGKLFVGRCLILVWSVTKEIMWASVRLLENKDRKGWSRKTKSSRFAKLSFLNQLIWHSSRKISFKCLILDFGKNLGWI